MMSANKPPTFLRLQNDLDSTGIDSACIAFPLRLEAFSRRSWEAAIRNRTPIGVQAGLMIWLATAPAAARTTELKPEATQGFDRYEQLTEARMQHEVAPGGDFLRVDSLPEPRRSQEYARLRSGEMVAERLHTSEVSGEIRMPGAMIHHSVGTIFIPRAILADVLADRRGLRPPRRILQAGRNAIENLGALTATTIKSSIACAKRRSSR